MYDLKNKKKFGLSWKIFSFHVVLGLRGIIVAPPIMVQSKKCFPKILLFIQTNIEIVQNSKSNPKKFSFLCTFKLPLTPVRDLWIRLLVSRWLSYNILPRLYAQLKTWMTKTYSVYLLYLQCNLLCDIRSWILQAFSAVSLSLSL